MGSEALQSLPGWSHVSAGKVWDMFVPVVADLYTGGESMLMVASDRISVCDRLIPTAVPGKGALVAALTRWWFDQIAQTFPVHLTTGEIPPQLAERSVLVQQLWMFPVECTVHGYMSQQLRHSAAVLGAELNLGRPAAEIPIGEKLAKPCFIPAVKGKPGAPDLDLTEKQFTELVGKDAAVELRNASVQLYQLAHQISYRRGLVLVNAKLEFGTPTDPGESNITLADEAFTPDTASFWRVEDLEAGNPEHYDKRYLQEWIQECTTEWNPACRVLPFELPPAVVTEIQSRYRTVYEMLTGEPGESFAAENWESEDREK
ncbi:MAG: phosphoribosylaminoimidazolesuccinocarboxamide synthase [Trueperella sp.]|nr:phosphoribosylaminoimidazolesuccinocarboxamide synthase [Trueperella sp.]